jgi:hypothetical protein
LSRHSPVTLTKAQLLVLKLSELLMDKPLFAQHPLMALSRPRLFLAAEPQPVVVQVSLCFVLWSLHEHFSSHSRNSFSIRDVLFVRHRTVFQIAQT